MPEQESFTLRWFDDSPDAGDPACICSLCGNQISEEDAPAIRVFHTEANMEARFHLDCARAIELI